MTTSLLLSAAVIGTAAGGPAAGTRAGATITLGTTTIGTNSDAFAINRKRANSYALAQAGTVTKLSVYLAPTAVAGQEEIEGVVYADAAGAPGALLASSEQLTFASTEAAGWYDLPLATALNLSPGRYWIGVITGGQSDVAGFRYATVAGSRDYNANSYTAGPSNPFGSFSTDGEQMSLYATLSVATGPPAQPTGLSATAAGANQIDLAWSEAGASGVAGYTIYRNGAFVTYVPSPATSFTDGGLNPATAYSYAVDAYNSAGQHSAQSAPASATTGAATGVAHYEYVFPADAMDVYDLDNGMRLIKQVSLPGATDIRGAAASPATGMLYVSYGGDGGVNGTGSMLAYDLLTNKIVWTKSYSTGIDSMAITPDGKTIYMPTGEASSGSTWEVIDAATGNVTGSISGGTSPHNTIVSLNGQGVYLGGRNSSYLDVASTASGTVFRRIGPLIGRSVRPFTINGTETLAFTTATGYLGFQVSDITTGKVLYTVPVTGPFPYTPGQPGPSTPSHGISLSPDEQELYLMDQPNDYVHVFDLSGLPASPPIQIANLKLTRPMTGSQAGCTYDCLREGWLQHTLDGRFVIVGDSGDVISTTTRTSVANLGPLYNSRVFLEIDWRGGVPIATSTRSGLGYVTR